MSWFNVQARAGVGEIAIFDAIGKGGVTAAPIQKDLAALGNVQQITLRINSPGGEIFTGLSIYAMLKRHKARITVTIDGIAASMASAIAMAGDRIIMPENAAMMVHEAQVSMSHSTSTEMRTEADAIDRMNLSMIGIYAERSKQPHEQIAAWMRAETWFTARQAVEARLCRRNRTAGEDGGAIRRRSTYASTPQALRDAAMWERAIAKVQL